MKIMFLCLKCAGVFPHPRPEHMVSPEPRSPLLDILHHSLSVGVYGLLGDWDAHVGVDSIFGGVRKQSNSIPIETRAEGQDSIN